MKKAFSLFLIISMMFVQAVAYGETGYLRLKNLLDMNVGEGNETPSYTYTKEYGDGKLIMLCFDEERLEIYLIKIDAVGTLSSTTWQVEDWKRHMSVFLSLCYNWERTAAMVDDGYSFEIIYGFENGDFWSVNNVENAQKLVDYAIEKGATP